VNECRAPRRAYDPPDATPRPRLWPLVRERILTGRCSSSRAIASRSAATAECATRVTVTSQDRALRSHDRPARRHPRPRGVAGGDASTPRCAVRHARTRRRACECAHDGKRAAAANATPRRSCANRRRLHGPAATGLGASTDAPLPLRYRENRRRSILRGSASRRLPSRGREALDGVSCEVRELIEPLGRLASGSTSSSTCPALRKRSENPQTGSSFSISTARGAHRKTRANVSTGASTIFAISDATDLRARAATKTVASSRKAIHKRRRREPARDARLFVGLQAESAWVSSTRVDELGTAAR